jgi:hypothetical protein
LMNMELSGSGKRGRGGGGGGGGDNDKLSVVAKFKTEYMMKSAMLGGSTIPFIADLGRAIHHRADHDVWFNRLIDTRNTEILKEIRDGFAQTLNSGQKVRVLVKALFEPELSQAASAETSLKMTKAMPDGLLDQYMMFVVSSRYMLPDGTLVWEEFVKSLDLLISNRHRDEGRAAAGAEGRAAAAMVVG